MAFAAALVMNCVWGGNPVAVKLGLEAFPPLWSAFLRFCLGIACVAVWARFAGIRLFPSPEEWKPYLGLSLLFGVQIWIMNVGYGLTTSIMGAVLMSVYPLVAALLGPLAVAGDRLDAVRALGLVAAFIGTATVLLGEGDTGRLEVVSVGNWLVLLSGTLLGVRLVISARIMRAYDPTRATFWQMVLAQPWFLGGALATEAIAWHAIGWRPIAGIAFQGVIIAGVGFMTIAYLLRRYRPSTMISFGFVTPVSGAALGAWIPRRDGDPELRGGPPRSRDRPSPRAPGAGARPHLIVRVRAGRGATGGRRLCGTLGTLVSRPHFRSRALHTPVRAGGRPRSSGRAVPKSPARGLPGENPTAHMPPTFANLECKVGRSDNRGWRRPAARTVRAGRVSRGGGSEDGRKH